MGVRGAGVAAANLIRVRDGAQTVELVAAFDGTTGRMAPLPIRFGGEEELLYLTFYGTGLRGHGGLNRVELRVGGELLPVLYCGSQSVFIGLDQVNAGPLPRSLAGYGEAPVVLSVEGQRANTVTLLFH